MTIAPEYIASLTAMAFLVAVLCFCTHPPQCDDARCHCKPSYALGVPDRRYACPEDRCCARLLIERVPYPAEIISRPCAETGTLRRALIWWLGLFFWGIRIEVWGHPSRDRVLPRYSRPSLTSGPSRDFPLSTISMTSAAHSRQMAQLLALHQRSLPLFLKAKATEHCGLRCDDL